MNGHVLKQLPLWVEGDLAGGEAEAVLAHLEGCPACRTAADALQASQAWLKSADPLPFSAADRLALRASVMTQLRHEGRPSRLRSFRPYVLAAAAAALVIFVIPRFHSTPSVSAPETSPAATAASAPTSTVTTTATPPTASRRRPGIAHAKPAPDPDPIPAGSHLTRIELQTTHPHIRIIWLAKAEPAPEPARDSIEPTTEVP